jgi:hypothetical protein
VATGHGRILQIMAYDTDPADRVRELPRGVTHARALSAKRGR